MRRHFMASLMASLTATAFLAATSNAQAPAQSQIPTLTLAAGPATAAAGWIDYKPEGGRFRVDMPTLPKIAIVQVPVGNGNSVPMTEATSIVRQVAYVASYTDYPNTVTKGAAAEVILNQVRNGAGTGATIRDEKKLQLGRAEGREYVVVQSNGSVSITRTYWSRGRLFQVTVEGKAGIETQAATRHFLESFALVQ